MASTTYDPTGIAREHEQRTRERLRAVARLAWLLPLVSALTVWGTLEHQPNPTTRFTDWSEFVTTPVFLVQHVLVSIGGQTLFVLGTLGLAAALVARSTRYLSGLWGVVLAVLGSGGLIAGFGLAAFGQPAVGDLHLRGYDGAQDVYDAMYTPVTFVVLLSGALLWAISTPLLAWSARGIAEVGRWPAWLFGVSGPLVGVLGVLVGPLQTVGSVFGLVGGAMLAFQLTREASTPG